MNLNDSGSKLIDEAGALDAELADMLERIASLAGEGDMIASIFRAAHAVNGSAGAFTLDQFDVFSRAAKDVLDSAHQENLRISGELESSLSGVFDQLSSLIDVLTLCDLADHFNRLDDFARIAQRLLGTVRYQKLCRRSSLAAIVQDARAHLDSLMVVRTFCEPTVYFRAPARRIASAH